MFRAIGVLTSAAVLSLAVAGSTMAASRSEIQANMNMCKRLGWSVAQAYNGGTFASQDDCLSYAKQGGQVFKPSFVFSPALVPLNTDAWMYVTGFHKNSHGTLTETLIGGPNAGSQFSFLNVPTNAYGNMAVISTVFTACDGTAGLAWSFTDVYGVHASANVWVNCAS